MLVLSGAAFILGGSIDVAASSEEAITAEYIKKLKITWSQEQWTSQAKPGFQVFFREYLNFTSSSPLTNAKLVVSDELKRVIRTSDEYLDSTRLGATYHAPLYYYMPPGTTSGWYNGTVSVLIEGFTITDSLPVNILVPEIQSTSVPGANGGIFTYMVTPSYSPFWNYTSDVAMWFTYPNGTSVLINVSWDAFDSTINGKPFVNITTDRSTYGSMDTEVIISGSVMNEIRSERYDSVKISIRNSDTYSRDFETRLKLSSNGTFSLGVPIRGTFSNNGSFEITAEYNLRMTKISFNLTENTIGNFSTFSQNMPSIRYADGSRLANDDLPTIESSKPVIIRASIEKNGRFNNFSGAQIIEIRDSEGVTQEITVKTIRANHTCCASSELQWTPPQSGIFKVHTTIVSDMIQPQILAAPKILTVKVL